MVSNCNDYQRALKRLFLQGSYPKLGLSRMRGLLERLGNPHEQFQSLHIAGTNGKGSTCAFLDAILREAKTSRGLYTSPHLLCARERIQINGQLISENEFVTLEEMVHRANLENEPATFFERITAMAFLAFARAGIKVAVVEVGMGGRFDATNVIQPIACGITPIGLDHQEFLGDSIGKIAFEKAGILKTGVLAVVSAQEPVAHDAISRCGQEIGAQIFSPTVTNAKPSLFGRHQIENASVAATMIRLTKLADEAVIKAGIQNAIWPGRYETVNSDPLVILDGAHNQPGFTTLWSAIEQDQRLAEKPMILVTGMTTGHNEVQLVQSWANNGPKPAAVFVTRSKAPRSLDEARLAALWRDKSFEVFPITSVARAVEMAMKMAVEKRGYVLATGSLYVAGEARGLFFEVPSDDRLPHY